MGQSKRKGGSSNKKGSTEKATSEDTASPEQLKNESQHRTSSLMGKLRSEVKDIYQNDIDIIASNFHYKRRPTEVFFYLSFFHTSHSNVFLSFLASGSFQDADSYPLG